jgi:hypothetical protein
LALTGDLTLKSAPEIYARLGKALQSHAAVTAAVAPDAAVDISFVQLIESARRTAKAAEKVLALAAPAAGSLLDVLRRGGFLADNDPARRDFWMLGGEPGQ